MILLFGFEVWEKYKDFPMERFGTEALSFIPEPGDKLLLHWLDGREAYQVQVLEVDQDNMKIFVEKKP